MAAQAAHRHRHGAEFGHGYVLGICKAYTTRVGQGPFPTELMNEIGEEIGRRGKEFGVNTGRKRRTGWFDAVLVRQTVRTCGIHGLALTKLDILDGFDSIEVCVGYMLDGKEIDHLPAGEGAQSRVVPIYETIEGWKRADRQCPFLGGFARRRPSNTSAGSRNWWAVRLLCFPPSPRTCEDLLFFRPKIRLEGLTRYYRKACNVEQMADYYPLIARAIAGLDPRCSARARAAVRSGE